MAKNENNVRKAISIGNILATPVLNGSNVSEPINAPLVTNQEYRYFIWTGAVNSHNIDSALIEDEEKRDEFIKLTREFEDCIIECRFLTNNENKPQAPFSTQSPLERQKRLFELKERIANLSKQIAYAIDNPKISGIDRDLYFFYLVRDYESILDKNPKEFKLMRPEERKELRGFTEYIYKNPLIIGEVFDVDKDRYLVYPLLTPHLREKFNFQKNKESFANATYMFHDKDKSISSKKGVETIKQMASSLTIHDLLYIFNEENLAIFAIGSVYRNVVLDKITKEIMEERLKSKNVQTSEELKASGKHLTTVFNEDEIKLIREEALKRTEKMSDLDIEQTALEYYPTISPEESSEYIANALIDNVGFVDTGKFLLISAYKHLKSLDSLRVIQNSNDDASFEEEKKKVETEIREAAKQENDENVNVAGFDSDSFFVRMAKIRKMLDIMINSGKMASKASLSNYYDLDIKDMPTYSMKDVKELMKNFVGDIYISDGIKLPLIYDAYTDKEKGVSSWSDELIRRLDLSEDNIITLSFSNLDNFKRFYDVKIVSQEMLEKIIELSRDEGLEEAILDNTGVQDERNIAKAHDMKENAMQFIPYLYKNGIIDENKLLDCLKKGLITLDEIRELRNVREEKIAEFDEKLQEEFSEENVIATYEEIVKLEIKLQELIREKELHPSDEIEKEINSLKGKLNELNQRKQTVVNGYKEFNHISNGGTLTESVYFEVETEFENEDETEYKELVMSKMFASLYEDKLISIANIQDISNDYLMTILDKLRLDDMELIRNELDPLDENNRSTEEGLNRVKIFLNNIMQSENYDDSQKYSIMMNMLSRGTKDDRDLIKDYRNKLKIGKATGGNSAEKSNRRKKGNSKDDYDTKIYPDYVKWAVFKLLDKEARITRYANGYVEIASTKIPYRIIEKFYDASGNDASGSATYCVKNDIYEKVKYDLVSDTDAGKVIEPSVLKRIDVTPKKERIAHITRGNDDTKQELSNSSWMRKIAEKFGYTFDKKSKEYNKEVVDKLVRLSHEQKSKDEIE